MIQNLLMFMAPENIALNRAYQATLQKPPAKSSLSPGAASRRVQSLKFMASVAGNAVGFAAIMAACWLSLQLLQTYL